MTHDEYVDYATEDCTTTLQPTRLSEQVVTEEMVARASAEYREIFGKHLLSNHARRILEAAMEARR